MKRILLSSTFVFACLLGACSNEDVVICDVVWSAQDDTELGVGASGAIFGLLGALVAFFFRRRQAGGAGRQA